MQDPRQGARTGSHVLLMTLVPMSVVAVVAAVIFDVLNHTAPIPLNVIAAIALVGAFWFAVLSQKPIR